MADTHTLEALRLRAHTARRREERPYTDRTGSGGSHVGTAPGAAPGAASSEALPSRGRARSIVITVPPRTKLCLALAG